ncbi:FERM domain-containing protein 4A isoform X3 [Patella vulgata]|uniref:FERM domain-containing protein 4A isoform X3 n=1 Tax=Patella vulgata TaxID=6465 RepID=UPI00218052E3|nr:FERM domain-containing protein 4A isoform X3 [Patella vulgata]
MSMKSKKRVSIREDPEVKTNRETRSRSRSRFRARRSKSMDVPNVSKDESLVAKVQKRERSLVNLVRAGSRRSVQNLVKLFELKGMNDGRKSQVILLDERRLDIVIQPKLYTSDLLDMVSSHFRLKEKQYFGIAFIDETGHYNWLNSEKRVLDHDFPKKNGVLTLHFSIRFYIETIGLLRDIATVELFYLNARQTVFKGLIECDSETVFELAAHVLQLSHGDYISDEETKNELKKLPVIPTFVLKEHPSIGYCEDRVIHHYKKLAGSSRGSAIVNYMTIVENIPTYGIHCYEVKDKKGLPWWLGISPKGIYLFDKNDKSTPRRIFLWKSLENLYYRDKKFSIEVHDPKRVSVSRRTFGAGNVNVHAWFAVTPQLTKCIWSMAVSQHQFYLDRKQSKSLLPSARSMSEIAADLSRSTTSLPGSIGSDLSRSTSSQSLPSLSSSRFDLNIEQSDTLKAQREMYQALKARKEALEDALKKKTEELKNLCFQEGELTGELPADTPLGPGEKAPVFRRRVGTAFSLTSNMVKSGDEREDVVAKLELECELQGKIMAAAQKLAQDKSVSKSVRKQRRQAYLRAVNKMKDMEKKLTDMKKHLGINRGYTTPYDVLDENEEQHVLTDSDTEFVSPISPTTSPPVYRAHRDNIQGDVSQKATRPQAFQTNHPHSHSHLENHSVPSHLSLTALSPSHSSPQLTAGFQPSNVTRTQYRNQMYPTLTNRSQSSSSNQSEYDNMKTGGRLEGSLDSGFSSANNMYNINSQRTSHYNSMDKLKSPTHSGQRADQYDRINLTTKHGSLEGAYRKKGSQGQGQGQGQKYGSLERNKKPDQSERCDAPLPELRPSRYGSKRESASEYSDPETPTPQSMRMVEVPVQHETAESHYYTTKQFLYGDSYSGSEQSTVGMSPRHDRNLHDRSAEQCYSPRTYEGSFPRTDRRPYSPGYDHNTSSSSSVNRMETQPSSSKLVTVTRYQPQTEVTKPYELSDFYKYSEKLRRKRQVDIYQKQLIGVDRLSRSSTPSQSSEGDYPSPNSSQPSSPYRGVPSSHPLSPNQSFTSRDYEQSSYSGRGSPEITTSTTYHSVKTPGTHYSTTVYKSSQHIQSAAAAKHSSYQPPRAMACQPVKNPSAFSSPSSSPSTVTSESVRALSPSGSSFSINSGPSLVEGFSDEILAWFDDHDTTIQPPTLV